MKSNINELMKKMAGALEKKANWFEKSTDPERMQKSLNSGWGQGCEHVEKDNSLAYIMISEMDSFGGGESWIPCRTCYENDKEKEGEEMSGCQQCKQAKKKKEIREWRWYDFYAAQGDEPMRICEDCWGKPEHQRRMEQDRRENYEESRRLHGYQDDWYDDDDDDGGASYEDEWDSEEWDKKLKEMRQSMLSKTRIRLELLEKKLSGTEMDSKERERTEEWKESTKIRIKELEEKLSNKKDEEYW